MRITSFLLLLCFGVSSFAQDSWNIDLLYHWKVDTLKPSVQHFNTYNEVWGHTKNNTEYAIIGSTWGTHILDVTNPTATNEVVSIQGYKSDTFVVHRDYHDYMDYLYIVCDEGASALRIVDLSHLPDSAPTVYVDNSLFARSHNIFIDTATANLYTCGGNNNPGVRVFSLANPELPVEVASISLPETSHDIYVRNDTAYINVGTSGFMIYDFNDLQNPTLIGSLTSYAQQGYNHSGWLTDDGNTYILADETHGKDLKSLDVSDFGNIEVLDTVNSQSEETMAIPHNVMIKGDYAYISYYFDGLVIFDISDPSSPIMVGYYDTSTEIHTNGVYRGCWGTYTYFPSGTILASDMQNGLYVFNVDQATAILEQESISQEKVFPNPFNNSFNLISNKNEKYEILTIDGKIIESGITKQNVTPIELNSAYKGIYFLRTANGTYKLIKS